VAEEGKSESQYSWTRTKRLILDAVRYRGFDMAAGHVVVRTLLRHSVAFLVCKAHGCCAHVYGSSLAGLDLVNAAKSELGSCRLESG
jgi:hypothetical protein